MRLRVEFAAAALRHGGRLLHLSSWPTGATTLGCLARPDTPGSLAADRLVRVPAVAVEPPCAPHPLPEHQVFATVERRSILPLEGVGPGLPSPVAEACHLRGLELHALDPGIHRRFPDLLDRRPARDDPLVWRVELTALRVHRRDRPRITPAVGGPELRVRGLDRRAGVARARGE